MYGASEQTVPPVLGKNTHAGSLYLSWILLLKFKISAYISGWKGNKSSSLNVSLTLSISLLLL